MSIDVFLAFIWLQLHKFGTTRQAISYSRDRSLCKYGKRVVHLEKSMVVTPIIRQRRYVTI